MSVPHRPARRPRALRARTAQRGIILVITLVAMVVLLVGLAAILRSVDTSGMLVGNLAFRRDLTNRAEQAIAAAKVTLQTSSFDFTASAMSTAHYSAVKLTNGSTGVPTVLDSSNATTGYNAVVGADATDASVTGDTSVTYRYVIDRQCNAGTTTFSKGACEYIESNSTLGGSSQLSSGDRHISDQTLPIYRISVRVSGPRNSVAYFQTTYVIN
jgi:type IV pilus assembly protein PilX